MFHMGTPDVLFLIFACLHKAHAAARVAVAIHEHFSPLDRADVLSSALDRLMRFLFSMIPEGAYRSIVVPGKPYRLAGISAPVNEHLQVYSNCVRDPYCSYS